MRRRTLSISILAMLLAALALYGCANRPAKNAAAKPQHSARPASRADSAKDKKAAQATQNYIESDMRDWGHEVPSAQAASDSVKRKIELADESLAGGKPIFRVDWDIVAVIYPDAWIASGPWMWPGQDPRQYYANFVKRENALPDNQGPSKWPKNQTGGPAEPVNYQLMDIGGNPGYGCDKGNNLIEGKLDPRPAVVIWTQDGIEYHAFGFIPVAKLIKIAESMANSN